MTDTDYRRPYLDLYPDEWLALLDMEGTALHRCCGDIGDLREILFYIICERKAATGWAGKAFLKGYDAAVGSHPSLGDDGGLLARVAAAITKERQANG